MAWIYLLLAGICEIGWPVGLKLAQGSELRVLGTVSAAACIALSGFLMWLAQKDIAMGTVYAVWTGIGAAGTFLVGVWFFGDPVSLWRYAGVLLIVGGVLVLRLAP